MLIDHFTWIPQIWVSSFLKITLEGLRTAPRARSPSPWQAQHAANRAQAPHVTYADQAFGTQDDLLFKIYQDARYRDWLVHQSLRVWIACV